LKKNQQATHLFILALLLLSNAGLCKSVKDTCYTGLYLKNIYDMRPDEYACTADYWIWFNYKDSVQDPLENVEIINAKQTAYTDQYHTKDLKGMLVANESGRVTLTHNWELENYPFDKQAFNIQVEAGLDTSKMVLVPCERPFRIYKDLNMPGWTILSSKINQRLVTYDSDFGESRLHGRSTFSRIIYVVNAKRNGWGLFFKLILGVYVSFFVAYLVFFLPPANEQRFSLSLGALFAAVANKYVTDSNIPTSISFSFVDQVHVFTFVFILATLVLSVISLRIDKSGRHQRSKDFNRLCIWIVPTAYFILNAALILLADNG
jgi:hypothetical protein